MISWLKDKYKGSSFVRNFTVMVSGNGLSLVIPFILAPLLTRLYAPEDFAGYELFASIVALLGPLSSFRYEFGIILPKSGDEADGITKMCFKILLTVTIFSGLVFIPFRNDIAIFSGSPALSGLMWWLPVAVFFTGGVIILNQNLLRQESFKVMATNKVLSTTSNHGSKYFLGLVIPNAAGLSIGHVIGMIVPFLTLFRRTEVRNIFKRMVSKNYDLKTLAKKYRQFPLYNTPHAFYDEGHRTLLFFLIAMAYGEVTLGLLALTIRYLRIPVNVFGSSISQIFVPKLAQDFANNVDIRPTLRKIMWGSALAGIVPFGLIMLFGEPVFGFVFGPSWADAGRYAAILAPWLFFNFITSPVSMIPTVVARQGAFFAITAFFTSGALLAIFVMWKLGFAFDEVIYVYTGINALFNVGLIFWFLRVASSNLNES